jgi:hypothetical protein
MSRRRDSKSWGVGSPRPQSNFAPCEVDVAGRECRFRKQRSSARKNASPTFVVHCHGARTRGGPRGGGRLRVLSTVAFAPPSIVFSTGAPGRRRPCAHFAQTRGGSRGDAGLLKRTIASDATYSLAGNRIASRGTAASWAKGSPCVRGRGAIDAVSRIVELGSRKQPCFAVRCNPRLSAECGMDDREGESGVQSPEPDSWI